MSWIPRTDVFGDALACGWEQAESEQVANDGTAFLEFLRRQMYSHLHQTSACRIAEPSICVRRGSSTAFTRLAPADSSSAPLYF